MRCPYPFEREVQGYYFKIPCGRCIACRLNKAREWSCRIMNELIYHKDACFLTLTYDDEHLPKDFSVHKDEFQKFMKRFRKEFGLPVRFFASGEYGETTFRPHYHIVLFGVSPVSDIFIITGKSKGGYWCDLKSWPNGHCFVGDVTYDSACYVAKYTAKKLCANDGKVPLNDDFYLERGVEPPFLLMSRRPGIGAKYFERNRERLVKREYIVGKDGAKLPLPRFYKNKIDKSILSKLWKSLSSDWSEENKAKAVGKNIFDYRDDFLEDAKNRVDTYLRNKFGGKNGI